MIFFTSKKNVEMPEVKYHKELAEILTMYKEDWAFECPNKKEVHNLVSRLEAEANLMLGNIDKNKYIRLLKNKE